MIKVTDAISSIIQENKRRRDILFSPYDPVTGLGSPLERVPVRYTAGDVLYEYAVPAAMYEEYKELLFTLNELGSVEEVMRKFDLEVTPQSIDDFLQSLVINRFRYDFEYWAFITAKIEDKRSKQDIPFKLNRPQRKLFAKLEEMRLAGVPIRVILVKARQWGGSTLVQIYMAWMQLIHKTNWHSAIVADVEDQARHIRGMYSKLGTNYPKEAGTVTFAPYEGSSKNRMIQERGCIVGVGSAQKPDSLRSFSFAMTHLCLAPGTLVPTGDGFVKKVENLLAGDMVITHNGKPAKVNTVSCSRPNQFNGNGNAISIHPWLGHKITLTPNHPVFTKRGWVPSEELSKEDWISMPVRSVTDEIKKIQLPFYPMRKQGGGKAPKGNGMSLELNQEVGFALGYYLAEGHAHVRKNRIGYTDLAFVRHDNEVAFGDRAIKALLPYSSSHVRVKRKGVQTTVEVLYGAVLSNWIGNNLGAKDQKRIPDWFFKCGKDFLLGVFQGYLSGDGNKTNGKQANIHIAGISATTISSSIATQIRDIGASLGFGWAAIDIKEAGILYGRNCQKAYTVRWAGSAARKIRHTLIQDYPQNGHSYSEKTELTENHVWIKIRKIEHTTVERVYDVEVDHPDHSFRTIYFSVKNSEVGLWKSTPQKSAEDLVQGLRSTVPNVPDSIAVVESTAKGVGNFFHREWQSAVNKESAYQPVFVAWHEIEEYQKDITDYDKFIKWVRSNDYAQFLWNLGATLEGISWYFWFKAAENYDDWRMKSEYPSTDIEAFQSTGRRVFAPAYVQKARKNCIKPEAYGDLYAKAQKGKEAFENLEFQLDDKGLFLIWSRPDKEIKVSNRYLVTVDIGGRTYDADWSVIKVFDRYWMMEGGKPEVVACWRGHIDQDLVAWKAAQIAKWYNDALLVVEENSLDKTNEDSEGDHFLTILNEVVKVYSNIYARTDPAKVRQGLPIKYGFHTDRTTKPMVIDELNGALREEAYYERDLRACDEMDTYEIKPDGKYGAVEGCHDDLVMVTAIGVWICFKFMPMPKIVTEGKTRTRNRIISEASI